MATPNTPPELRIISHSPERDPALVRGLLLKRQEALRHGVQFEYAPGANGELTLAMIAAGLGQDWNRDVENPLPVDEIGEQDYLERYSDVSTRARRYLGEKATLMLPGDQLVAVASPDFVSHVANSIKHGSVPHTGAILPATELRVQYLDGRWQGTMNQLKRKK